MNETYVRKGDRVDNLTVVERPEPERVCPLNAERWLENGDGNDKVTGQDDVLVKVNIQSMGTELLAQDVQLLEVSAR